MVELILPRALHAEIIAHARAGAPEEVCGLVAGRGSLATGLVRARNVAPSRLIDYIVDDQTLLQQFAFEARGEEMVAIYHSHPASPAFPSATDALRAYYPDAAYIICSLEQPRRPVLRAFHLRQAEPTPVEAAPDSALPVRDNHSLRVRYDGGPYAGRYDLYEVATRGWTWTACALQEIALVIV